MGRCAAEEGFLPTSLLEEEQTLADSPGQAVTGLLLLPFSSSSSLLQLLRDRVVPEVPDLAKGDSHIRLDKYRVSS